jgi:chromate transporter
VKHDELLLALLVVFAPLSLLTIGGGLGIMGDVQRAVVLSQGWFTQPEFLELFALSRVAPGPGTLIVTLIGSHVAGWSGAIIASLAIFGPSSLLTYAAAHFWHRGGSPAVWQRAVVRGLAPIAAGLILSSTALLLHAAPVQLAAWPVAIGVAILCLHGRLGPITLLLLGAGAYLALIWILPSAWQG